MVSAKCRLIRRGIAMGPFANQAQMQPDEVVDTCDPYVGEVPQAKNEDPSVAFRGEVWCRFC
jgi:hypothetical protein